MSTEASVIDPVAAAVGRISSGLYIITTAVDGIREGYLGSWVQQASFKPLILSVAIRPGRPCFEAIQRNGCFVVNIVSTEAKGLLRPFWKPQAGDAFSDLKCHTNEQGVVLDEAVAWLGCQRCAVSAPGDHHILFANVVAGGILHPAATPMTHLRKSGLDY